MSHFNYFLAGDREQPELSELYHRIMIKSQRCDGSALYEVPEGMQIFLPSHAGQRNGNDVIFPLFDQEVEVQQVHRSRSTSSKDDTKVHNYTASFTPTVEVVGSTTSPNVLFSLPSEDEQEITWKDLFSLSRMRVQEKFNVRKFIGPIYAVKDGWFSMQPQGDRVAMINGSYRTDPFGTNTVECLQILAEFPRPLPAEPDLVMGPDCFRGRAFDEVKKGDLLATVRRPMDLAFASLDAAKNPNIVDMNPDGFFFDGDEYQAMLRSLRMLRDAIELDEHARRSQFFVEDDLPFVAIDESRYLEEFDCFAVGNITYPGVLGTANFENMWHKAARDEKRRLDLDVADELFSLAMTDTGKRGVSVDLSQP